MVFILTMGNIREERKRARMNKVKSYIRAVAERKEKLDKAKLINWLIVEDAISMKVAKEEVEAIIAYEEYNLNQKLI